MLMSFIQRYERLVCVVPAFGLSTFSFKGPKKRSGRRSTRRLDQHQRFHLSCLDKTTLSGNPSDMAEPAKQPLQGLKLASHVVLEKAQERGRLKCVKCGGSRMFFCYTCCSLVGVSPDEVPVVKVVLVFPGPRAVTVQNIIPSLSEHSQETAAQPRRKKFKVSEDHPTHGEGQKGKPRREEGEQGEQGEGEATQLQKVVFIDSTWNQTNKISTDERLQDLLQVELKSRKTCFWRHQKGKPDTYLATIEAVYYFLRDFHELCLNRVYSGEYDNMLFFYSFLHSVVNKAKSVAGKL